MCYPQFHFTKQLEILKELFASHQQPVQPAKQQLLLIDKPPIKAILPALSVRNKHDRCDYEKIHDAKVQHSRNVLAGIMEHNLVLWEK